MCNIFQAHLKFYIIIVVLYEKRAGICLLEPNMVEWVGYFGRPMLKHPTPKVPRPNGYTRPNRSSIRIEFIWGHGKGS